VNADQRLGNTALARLAKNAIGGAASVIAGVSHGVYRACGQFSDLDITHDLCFGDQTLDVWRLKQGVRGPLVVFFHGGGFQQLDKGSHWAFAERFARMGAVVFNADYRLAPRFRHPAAADDAARAYDYALANAARFGADPAQVIVSGTSAGANLALGLAITHGARAAVLFSGLLQVSDMPRLYRGRSVPLPIRARMANIGVEYPPEGSGWTVPRVADPRLDPLLHIERNPPPQVATFISTGSADEVLEDSLRLHARLDAAGVPNELDVVPGAGHAFQGLLFKRSVRALWQRCDAFLRAQL
jgi:acetyl esterase/lipase